MKRIIKRKFLSFLLYGFTVFLIYPLYRLFARKRHEDYKDREGNHGKGRRAMQMSGDRGLRRRTPVIFIGHGSPINAVRDNEYTSSLKKLGRRLKGREDIKSVLVISAHWLTKGVSYVLSSRNPKTIHDFYGFPDILYSLNYPARGQPKIASEIAERLGIPKTDEWGLDHGAWVPLLHIFPSADIPVFQLSIDYSKPLWWHYEFSRELLFLREKGVLIIGSGNITHNLRTISPYENDKNIPDWAREFDETVKELILSGNFGKLIEGDKIKHFHISHPEPSHYIPLVYVLGLTTEDDKPSFPYEGFQYGTLSMRCVEFS